MFLLFATLTSISSYSHLMEQNIALLEQQLEEKDKATKNEVCVDDDDDDDSDLPFVSRDTNYPPTRQEMIQHIFNPFADGASLTRTITPVENATTRRDGSRKLTLPTMCCLKQ